MSVKQTLKEKLLRVANMGLPSAYRVYRNRLGIDEIDAQRLMDFKKPHLLMKLIEKTGIADICSTNVYDLQGDIRGRGIRNSAEFNKMVIEYYSEEMPDTLARSKFEQLVGLVRSHNLDNNVWLPSYNVTICNCKSAEVFDKTCNQLREMQVSYKELSREETIALTVHPNLSIRGFYTTLPNIDSRAYVFVTKGLCTSALKPIKELLYKHYTEAMKARNTDYYTKFWDESLDELYTDSVFTNNYSEVVDKILAKFEETINAEEKAAEERRKAHVTSVVKALPNNALLNAESDAESKRRSYEDQMVRMMNAEKAWLDAQNRVYAIKCSENKINEAVEVLLANLTDKIRYIAYDRNTTQLKILANNTLQFFDGNKIKTYLNNPRSTLSTSPKYVINLFIETFVKHTVKLHLNVGFKINVVSGDIAVLRLSEVSPSALLIEGRDGIPNPHHEYYNCWGDNRRLIVNAVQNGNLADAIMIAYAATAGINLSDTPVFTKLLDGVKGNLEDYYREIPYIEKDGKLLTITEYRQIPGIETTVMEV